ncbi:MAG: phosphatidylserine decarboxylase [Candidatus Buchananbacteria bacterium]
MYLLLTSLITVVVLVILFLIVFFRHPLVYTIKPGKLISPAEGKIVKICYDQPINKTDTYIEVYILLNLFNVHRQYVPLAGRVISLERIPGEYQIVNTSTTLRKLGRIIRKQNRLVTTIEVSNWTYSITQYSGYLPRRIINYLTLDQVCEAGQELGLICFGSLVMITLPADRVSLTIALGDKVTIGEVLGDLH